MSNHSNLAKKLPDSTPSEPLVRPKVMRRPAHFSATTVAKTPAPSAPAPARPRDTASENENLAASPAAPAASTSPAQKPWQDDIRFGIALLSILVLVNFALIMWLPHMRTPSAQGTTQTVVTTPAAQAPKPLEAPLTFYSKPEEPAAVHVLGGADSGPNQ